MINTKLTIHWDNEFWWLVMWKGLSYQIIINMKQKRYSAKEVAELVRHFSGLYRK